jgi:hypothetical protein
MVDNPVPPHCPITGATCPEDGEQEADDEPSLGFLERHASLYGASRDGSGNQERICDGLHRDLEHKHEGAEPDEDGEPSLGSLDDQGSQEAWSAGDHDRTDAECDPAESGVGDRDGLDEQVPFRDWQNVGMV